MDTLELAESPQPQALTCSRSAARAVEADSLRGPAATLDLRSVIHRVLAHLRHAALPANPAMAFLLICFIIFLGSVLAGVVPFFLRVSDQHLGLLSAFGAGLLVSTALAVILPEGMEAFYQAQVESDVPLHHALSGLAVTAGFVFMLLADHLQGSKGHLGRPAHDGDESLRDSERGLLGASERQRSREQQEAGTKAFFGLLIHSLADGVAVGTTGMSDKSELKLVVAFAMVLHKLPATFGLVSFLLASRWPRPRARLALLVFAASAPLAALATYWTLAAIPSFSSTTSVALWLLVSGGTFLYAACMHVLPHVASGEAQAGARDHLLSRGQVLAVVGGCTVPLGIQFLGGHH